MAQVVVEILHTALLQLCLKQFFCLFGASDEPSRHFVAKGETLPWIILEECTYSLGRFAVMVVPCSIIMGDAVCIGVVYEGF